MIFKAIQFVAEAHSGQYRKGSNIPYIYHLMNVMKTLLDYGCEDEVVTAGILHDVVEDTPVSIEEVENAFGKRVASIVFGASEPDHLKMLEDKESTWKERKQHTIDFILKDASEEQLLVICADKLDNVTSIRDDWNLIGDKIWERFNAPMEDQAWNYLSISKALEKRTKEFGGPMIVLFKQLSEGVNELFSDGLNN